jgi:large subunit ribosomal protein L24
MKQKFSTAWKASRQPRKQRKFRVNAPKHIQRKFLSSTLTKELRKKHGMRNIEIRKGDEVEIMRGKFDGKKGKVTEINMKKLKVAVENLQLQKRDGSKVNFWIAPAKLKILTLNLEDKKRMEKPIKQSPKEHGTKENAQDKK